MSLKESNLVQMMSQLIRDNQGSKTYATKQLHLEARKVLKWEKDEKLKKIAKRVLQVPVKENI